MAASIAQHGPFLAPTGTKLARQHPPRGATGTKLAPQHPTSTPTGTKLAPQHPTSTPTGTKLAPQHPTSAPTGTKLARQHPPSAPTGTKLAQQHPPRGATGTKLTQQHPTSTPTGTQHAQHTQNQQNSAILDMQGELSLAPGANPASRANFLSLIHHLGDDFRAADRHRLTVVHHRAHVAFCFFGPVSCTLKVASHGVPLQGAYTGLIRANSVHPVSTIKFPPTTTHAQIPTHPSTGQVPSGKLCTGLFGELERHTESAHS